MNSRKKRRRYQRGKRLETLKDRFGGPPKSVFEYFQTLPDLLKRRQNRVERGEVAYLLRVRASLVGLTTMLTHQQRHYELRGAVLNWTFINVKYLRSQLDRFLLWRLSQEPIGHWLLAWKGIGPVSAALIWSTFDPYRPHVGHWYSYAGLLPKVDMDIPSAVSSCWEPGSPVETAEALSNLFRVGRYRILNGAREATRDKLVAPPPWAFEKAVSMAVRRRSGRLHRAIRNVGWNIGVSARRKNPDELGKLYLARLEHEHGRNDRREFRDIAEARLAAYEAHSERKYWERGVLSPRHIDVRARLWTLKRFLAHVHRIWREHLGLSTDSDYSERFVSPEHLGPVLPPKREALIPGKPIRRAKAKTKTVYGSARPSA